MRESRNNKRRRMFLRSLFGTTFYTSKKWLALRYEFLKKNNYCECCGRGKRDGAKLHVDHIKPRCRYPELELEISNLQTLCAECNLGKGADDETDWRKMWP